MRIFSLNTLVDAELVYCWVSLSLDYIEKNPGEENQDLEI